MEVMGTSPLLALSIQTGVARATGKTLLSQIHILGGHGNFPWGAFRNAYGKVKVGTPKTLFIYLLLAVLGLRCCMDSV